MGNKGAELEVDEDAGIPRQETWRDFLYNSKDGTVLGRTGISWLKISVFYVIFYACLAGWFAGLLHILYSTLDEVAPTYYGKNSLIQANPAMGFRPMPLFDSTMIRFALSKPSSYRPYTDHLDAFFKNYDLNSESRNCTGDMNVTDTLACSVNAQQLLKDAGCERSKDYGFGDGQPCIVLKMNKLFDLKPTPYPSRANIDADLKEGERLRYISYAPGNIGVSCDGQNAVDSQFLKQIDFFPKDGLDTRYFPYKNQVGYRSPFVLAKFTNITREITIQVKCMLWATDIDNSDGKKKSGTVHFEFYIN